MKRILVLGSSHIGAIKSGINQLNEIKDFEFYFAGLAGYKFWDLRLSGTKVNCSKTNLPSLKKFSNVDVPIELSDFDKIVLVGTPSRLHPLLYYSTSCCSFVQSRECFKDIFYAIWTYPVDLNSRTMASELFRDLSDAFAGNIVFLGNPVPRPESILKRLKSISQECLNQWRKVYLWIQEESRLSFGDTSVPSIYLPNQSMLSSEIDFPLLKKEYFEELVDIQGQKTVSGNNKTADYSHANGVYGRDVLIDLIKYCL